MGTSEAGNWIEARRSSLTSMLTEHQTALEGMIQATQAAKEKRQLLLDTIRENEGEVLPLKGKALERKVVRGGVATFIELVERPGSLPPGHYRLSGAAGMSPESTIVILEKPDDPNEFWRVRIDDFGLATLEEIEAASRESA